MKIPLGRIAKWLGKAVVAAAAQSIIDKVSKSPAAPEAERPAAPQPAAPVTGETIH